MQAFVDQKVIAGAVTAVGSKDGPASLEAVGLQKIETKQPMPKDSLFRIASMTKPITARHGFATGEVEPATQSQTLASHDELVEIDDFLRARLRP